MLLQRLRYEFSFNMKSVYGSANRGLRRLDKSSGTYEMSGWSISTIRQKRRSGDRDSVHRVFLIKRELKSRVCKWLLFAEHGARADILCHASVYRTPSKQKQRTLFPREASLPSQTNGSRLNCRRAKSISDTPIYSTEIFHEILATNFFFWSVTL